MSIRYNLANQKEFMMHTCIECEWYSEYESPEQSEDGDGKGLCERFPPSIYIARRDPVDDDESDAGNYVNPMVSSCDRCGEWRARKSVQVDNDGKDLLGQTTEPPPKPQNSTSINGIITGYGTMNVNGETLTGCFVECNVEELRNFTVAVYSNVKIQREE